MIGYIEGKLIHVDEKHCLVLTASGVGYEVRLAGREMGGLPARGEDVSFYIRTVVREDALELYGFGDPAEREAFDVLVSLTKLGPKTAVSILSVHTAGELANVVLKEDAAALERVPGIGAKSARRILVELKGRLKPGTTTDGDDAPSSVSHYVDALSALMNLGYAETEAASALRDIVQDEPDLDVGELVRAGLQKLSSAKGS